MAEIKGRDMHIRRAEVTGDQRCEELWGVAVCSGVTRILWAPVQKREITAPVDALM